MQYNLCGSFVLLSEEFINIVSFCVCHFRCLGLISRLCLLPLQAYQLSLRLFSSLRILHILNNFALRNVWIIQTDPVFSCMSPIKINTGTYVFYNLLLNVLHFRAVNFFLLYFSDSFIIRYCSFLMCLVCLVNMWSRHTSLITSISMPVLIFHLAF